MILPYTSMELFILGLVFGVGAAKTKAVTKAVAKGYMTLADKTKSTADSLREDMRDAIEEVRNEQDENTLVLTDGDMETETIALQEAAAYKTGIDGNAYEETVEDFDTTIEAAFKEHPGVTTAAPAAGVMSVLVEPPRSKPGINIMKSLAKSYVVMTEKTKNATASFRENMRDAIEEARYEREQEAQRKARATDNTLPLEMMEPIAATNAEHTIENLSHAHSSETYADRPTDEVTATSAAPAPAAKAAPKEADKKAAKSGGKKSATDNGPTTRNTQTNANPGSQNQGTKALDGADIAIEIGEVALEVL